MVDVVLLASICSSLFRHVGGYVLLQALGKAVVEEEELAMRKKLGQQEVDAIHLKQYLDQRNRGRENRLELV